MPTLAKALASLLDSKLDSKKTNERKKKTHNKNIFQIVWLYNPTDVFTTWRLLRGNTKVSKDSTIAIRCLLYFAEVPPLGKLAIPVAFMPSEMIDYEVRVSTGLLVW